MYRSLMRFFNVDNKRLKNIVFTVFLLLAAAPFPAMTLAHTSQGGFAKWFYIFTAVWLGLAINLLLAAAAIRLVIWLMRRLKISFNARLFAGGVFAIALIFSVFGFWTAFHPQVKNIDISIKNLPREWQGKTVIQLSDVHLGHIHGASWLQDVVNKVNAQNPDLILITGDLFDGMDGDLNVFIKPLSNLRAKQGIFFITGNHEIYLGVNETLEILEQTGVKVLNNEIFNLDGLQIIGLAYPTTNDSAGITGKNNDEGSILDSLNFDKTKPSILMYHAPINIEQAASIGINLQLSGHTHKGQIWPFEIIHRLIYGRYYYGLHTLGDFSIYTTNGVGTWGPPMRTTGAAEIPAFRLE